MEAIFKFALIVHVATGAVSLVTGTMIFLRKKGDAKHRRTGRIFYYAMFIAGLSALFLSIVHPNHFLFTVGIFTLYLVITGLRYLRLKGSTEDVQSIDWGVSITMLTTSILIALLGIKGLIAGRSFGIIFMLFGLSGGLFSIMDFYNFIGKFKTRNFWLLVHLQRMTGAYIASATAFLVVNAKYIPLNIPPLLYWVLPSIVLVPVILFWNRKYQISN